MSMTRRNLLGAAAGFSLAGLAGATFLWRGSGGETEAETAGVSVDDVLFDPDNPVLGNPQGDITLTEFFDYNCPSAARWSSRCTG